MGLICRFKIVKSMMQNHFVEALMYLLKEYDSLSAEERYAFEFEPINSALDRLIPIYELSNNDFAELYAVRYGRKNIGFKRSQYLQDCVEKLQDYTSFFTNILNFKYAILCVKAQQKIASLCTDIDMNMLWVTYVTGIALYARLYDYKQLFEFCEEGLKVARENGDVELEFIIIARKWAQCYTATLQDPSLDIDLAQMETEEQLLRLYAPYDNNADNFVKSLIDQEMRKLEEVGPSGFSSCKVHIWLLEETINSYKMMLAQGREDARAVEYSLNQIKGIEKETYGEESKSDFRQVLALINNHQEELSPEQAQIVYRGALETASPEQVIPEGTEPMERFFRLVFHSGHLIKNKYKDNAIRFYEEAKNMVELLADPFLTATVLLTKARITQEDDIELAIKEKEDALALLDQAEASGCKYAMVDYLRYTMHAEMGDLFLNDQPKKSVEEFTKAIKCLETISLGQTLRISQLLNLRGVAHSFVKERDAEEKDYYQSFRVIIDDVRDRLPFMNSEKREKYWSKVFVTLQETMSFVDSDSGSELLKQAYQVVLLSKGLLLSSEQTVKYVIESDSSLAELRPIYTELEEKAIYSKFAEVNQEDVLNDYSKLYTQNVRLTRALNKIIAQHCDYLYETFEKVKERLGREQVLVDYFDYELYDGDQQYVAFVVTRENPTPILIKLCKESDLSKLFDDAKAGSTLFEVYNPRKRYSYELTKMLWKPIEEAAHMSLGNEIFIVPSGSLAKIPIESLPIIEGKDVVLSEYFRKFARLSHARALYLQNDGEIKSIALFGGLDYGQGNDSTNDSPKCRGYSVNTIYSDPTPLEAWQFLSGSRHEVDTIEKWLKTAGKEVKSFNGLEGTSDAFKSLSGKAPDIIHIASHGFFETKTTAVNLPALKTDNPMSLSGLVFANGNEGWLHGTPQKHEGIVTAAEIAQMELPSKIVVLSACHSGEGKLKADGVYGLQRGFKKAGVQCLIMSLWMMEDSAMQAFMELFYSKLIGGKDRHMAFFDTKHELMKATPNISWMWAGLIMLD